MATAWATRWVAGFVLFAGAECSPAMMMQATVSVGDLIGTKSGGFSQREVLYVEEFFRIVPEQVFRQLAEAERSLPTDANSQIVRGKTLDRQLIALFREPPPALLRGMDPAPSGVDRKILGRRLVRLDSRRKVLDVIYLPTRPPADRKR